MDYARKIGKSTEPRKWTKQPPRVLRVRDEPLCPDPEYKEDNRLKNWKRWLSNRKTQFDKIESKTGRRPTNQVMNSCETVRPHVETMTMLDHAAQPLPVIPDRFRGGPEFWAFPPLIPKSGPCLPDIRFAPSKKDLNEAPEFVHVGLPGLIEEEKGLAGLSSKTPLWKRSEYLRKRKDELLKDVEVPPTGSRHLVIQNRPFPKKIDMPRVPPITISNAEDEQSCDYPHQTAVLKIQDVEICQNFSSEGNKTEPFRWSVIFNSKSCHLDEKEIVFENKGNRVIIYQWRDANFHSKSIPLSQKISPFFFNKTKGVLLPGQFVRLKIWYRSRTAGAFQETWRLLTDPQLCPAPFIFRFWGHTSLNDRNKFTLTTKLTVDGYLDECIRNSVIQEIIDEIIQDIYNFDPPGPAYGSMFSESEVFLAKNSMCFYSPSLLVEFRRIYRSAGHTREGQWNLSINDLRDNILRIKQHERRRLLLAQLNEVYKKCLMPTVYKPVRSNKYEAVQNLLGYLFNRFEIESQLSKRSCMLDAQPMSEGDCEVIPKELMNNFVCAEIFFIRVYQLLAKTLEQIFASIDSFNNLEKVDK